MEKQPVGQLPDLTQSNNDDEIMVITDSEHNQLKKEKISDFITDLTSTNENNALTKGTDGKLFVTDFGNASNITEGTLPVDVLPESGVTADTYAYPSSVTVNAQGQVTAIAEGTPSGANADTDLSNLTETGENHFANPNLSNLTETGESHFANPNLSNLTDEGEKHFLNKTQITNCILSAPNGVATYSGNTITVKQGLKCLYANGRNSDYTINSLEYTLEEDISTDVNVAAPEVNRLLYLFVEKTSSGASLAYADDEIYYEQETQPFEPTSGRVGYWYNPYTAEFKVTINGGAWTTTILSRIGYYTCFGGQITSLVLDQPVELIKRTDPQIQAPYITETYSNGTSWYRVWSDGWCEQGGTIYNMPAGGQTYNLLKPYKDQNYILLADRNTMNFAQSMTNFLCGKPSGSQITLNHGSSKTEAVNWLAKGYVV